MLSKKKQLATTEQYQYHKKNSNDGQHENCGVGMGSVGPSLNLKIYYIIKIVHHQLKVFFFTIRLSFYSSLSNIILY